MKRYGLFIVVAMMFITMASCDSKNKSTKKNDSQSMLYTSGGRTSEVLVVMADQNWEKSAGDTIRKT